MNSPHPQYDPETDRAVVIGYRVEGRGFFVTVGLDLTVDEYTSVIVSMSSVLFDQGVTPMQLMVAMQQAAKKQNEADEAEPGPEEWTPGDEAA